MPSNPDQRAIRDAQSIFSRTPKTGDGLCREKVVRKILTLGPDRIQKLIEWGAKFDTLQDGSYDLGIEGGHSVRRILHSSDLTGKEIQQKLLIKAQSLPNIEFRSSHMAVNLIENKGHCVGVYILDIINDKIYAARAKATILATGGIGKVYLYTSNPDIASGDGIALAWRMGAEITNMEMVQFHPTCLYHPLAKNALITEAIRGEGAILYDQHHQRFMENLHPLKELAPRDIVARAIDRVLKETGDDYVFLDISFRR